MASFYKRLSYGFQLVPAIVAAVTSSLTSAGVDAPWLPVLTAISAVVSAVTTVLSPNKIHEEHLRAARDFTSLKHEVRFLHETESTALKEEDFTARVRAIHDKYVALARASAPTSTYFFKKAQNVIQSGTHEPDRNEDGSIK